MRAELAARGRSALSRASTLLSRKPFVKKFAVGMFSQGVLSLTNLIVRIWLARELTKSEYGLYVLGFEAIYIFISIQNALVSSPLTVLLPDKHGEERVSFLSGLGVGQWVLFTPLVILLAGSTVVLGYLGGFARVAWLLPLILAVPAVWMREWGRVVHYTELHVGRVLLMDTVFAATVLAGIALLGSTGILTGSRALLVLGGSFLVSAAAGQLLDHNTYRFEPAWVRSAFSETWTYSRWALIGIAASNVQIHGYIYVVSAVVGLAGAADLSATRVLLMPFALLVASAQRIFLAKGAQIRSQGQGPGFRRFASAFLLFFAVCWLLYVGILFGLRRHLIALLFTERYLNIEPYLVFWSILALIMAFRFVVTYSLQVFKEFKLLALYGVASAASVLLLSVVLLHLLGTMGAIFALISGELVLLLFPLPTLLRRLSGKKGRSYD